MQKAPFCNLLSVIKIRLCTVPYRHKLLWLIFPVPHDSQDCWVLSPASTYWRSHTCYFSFFIPFANWISLESARGYKDFYETWQKEGILPFNNSTSNGWFLSVNCLYLKFIHSALALISSWLGSSSVEMNLGVFIDSQTSCVPRQ